MLGIEDCNPFIPKDQDVSVKVGESIQHLLYWQLPHCLHDEFSVANWLSQSVNSHREVVDVSLCCIQIVDSAVQLVKVTTKPPDRYLISCHS